MKRQGEEKTMEGGDVGRGDRMGGKGCGGRKQEVKSIRTRARGYVIVHHPR